jgi:translation initiation factor 4G
MACNHVNVICHIIQDVIELRENKWKPRRDTNAPKTIDEVRKDAYRQEMEEKRQISNLPPPSMGDQRGGPSNRQPQGTQQTKKGDWNTVQSNKSSRFQIKKPDTVCQKLILQAV